MPICRYGYMVVGRKIASIFILLLVFIVPSGTYFLPLNNSPVENVWRVPASDSGESGREYGQSDDEGFNAYFDRYLRFIPDQKLRKTLSNYLNEVSQIHTGANESLEVSNQKMLDGNACFSEIAGEFYLDLMKDDLLRFKDQIERPNRPLGDRIALDEEAGKDFWKKQEPGFLWSKLMEITDGNPNLAISIVKLCGHDDAINQRPNLNSNHPAFRRLKQRQVRLVEFVEKNWKNPPEGISEALANLKNSPNVEFGCMAHSALFLPKSLGIEVDINDRLKTKIGKLQAPTKGPSALPAKYYHLLAGVFTGCRFKQETGYSFVGANLARQGARFYRAKSLKDYRLNAQLPEDLQKWDSITMDYFSDKKIRDLIALRKRTDRLKPRSSNDLDAYLIDLFPSIENDEYDEKSLQDWRQHLRKRVSQLDAAKLWKKWYSKTSLPGVGEVWLPNRSRRPEYDALRTSGSTQISPALVSSPQCGEKWTKERCLDAIAVMDSWEVDFEWSQEAQWVGARFGEKNCRKLEPNESLETLACSALAKRRTGPGTSTGDLNPHKKAQGADAVR